LGSVTRDDFLMLKFLFITNLTSDYNKNIFGFKHMPYLISFYFIIFIYRPVFSFVPTADGISLSRLHVHHMQKITLLTLSNTLPN
jgi:hypothetical protein